VRWQLAPGTTVLIGDGAYQIQLARNLLLRGVDPYGFDYTGTGLERAPWGQPFANPALHHLDYWPGTIVLPLPLQAAFQFITGWWDERIWLLVAGAAVFVLLRWLLPGPAGRMAAVAFFLIPGHSLLAVLGDNDLPMIVLLLAATLAIARARFLTAAILVGLAIATKQTALIALPVLVAFSVVSGMTWRALPRYASLSALAVLAILAPFIAWNPPAFVRDTILYNIGSGSETYPIQGIGLSSWLLQAGIIHGARDAFPFLLIQLPLVVAAWLLAWRWLRHHRAAGDVLVWMGLAFFVFLVTNRFAQPTYLLLGVELIAVGLLGRLPAARSATAQIELAASAA
jgi:4-amino-4-deoxy-L-arabinose transferase-like glycosyltransferase